MLLKDKTSQILLLETTIRTGNDNIILQKWVLAQAYLLFLSGKKSINDSNAKERNRSKKLYKRLNLAMTGGTSFDSSMGLGPPSHAYMFKFMVQ